MSENVVTKELWDFGMTQLENEQDWSQVINQESIKTWSKTLFPEEEIPTQKTVATFPYPMRFIYKCFTDIDGRSEWNANLADCKMIHVG
jgi:hypothetical protein